MNQTKPSCVEHGHFSPLSPGSPLQPPLRLPISSPVRPAFLSTLRVAPRARSSVALHLASPVLGLWLSLWSPWPLFIMTSWFMGSVFRQGIALPGPKADCLHCWHLPGSARLPRPAPSCVRSPVPTFLRPIGSCHLKSVHGSRRVKCRSWLPWNKSWEFQKWRKIPIRDGV